MPSDDGFIHPYFPNAAPAARRRMLSPQKAGETLYAYPMIRRKIRSVSRA